MRAFTFLRRRGTKGLSASSKTWVERASATLRMGHAATISISLETKPFKRRRNSLSLSLDANHITVIDEGKAGGERAKWTSNGQTISKDRAVGVANVIRPAMNEYLHSFRSSNDDKDQTILSLSLGPIGRWPLRCKSSPLPRSTSSPPHSTVLDHSHISVIVVETVSPPHRPRWKYVFPV